jgi:hypothetical protein
LLELYVGMKYDFYKLIGIELFKQLCYNFPN